MLARKQNIKYSSERGWSVRGRDREILIKEAIKVYWNR